MTDPGDRAGTRYPSPFRILDGQGAPQGAQANSESSLEA
jgi:hypothetical protein